MNRITEHKAKIIATEYIETKFDKKQALLNLGYSKCYATPSQGFKIYQNPLVKAEIDKRVNKIERISGITRDIQLDKLDRAADLARSLDMPGVVVSAIREQNAILGYHVETHTNLNLNASVEIELTSEQALERYRKAINRLERLKEAGSAICREG